MPTVSTTTVVDDDGLADLLRPRDDFVGERSVGEGRFEAAEGPFRFYERVVEARSATDGRHEATETTRFRLAIPFWEIVFTPPVRRALRRRKTSRSQWWAPPDRLDPRSARVLGLLCSLSVVAGFLGTLITQTITFAASEFGASKTAQSSTLAAVRVGVLLSLVLVATADRKGRRRLLLLATAAGCATAMLGAVAPNLFWLGVGQTVSRALSTVAVILLPIVAAEEMPAGSRAYAVSVLAMTAALGAGICLWVLPVADLGDTAWRWVYAVPLLGLPVVGAVARRLPESRRFVAPHRDTRIAGHGRRLWLLAVTFFCTSLFGAPASQLQNEFLRDERGYSAALITLFTISTATPGGIGIVIGGRMGDLRGRRLVTALGVTGGAVLTVAAYLSSGAALWLLTLGSILAASFAVPSLGAYQPELFPTALRGRTNGIIQLAAVTGSGAGLLIAGAIADQSSLGRAMAVLLVGPLLVGILVLTVFPETARRELEDINPEDRLPRPDAPDPGADVSRP